MVLDGGGKVYKGEKAEIAMDVKAGRGEDAPQMQNFLDATWLISAID